MKIEDEFLTIKQARKLKKLGVSFIGANFGIYNYAGVNIEIKL